MPLEGDPAQFPQRSYDINVSAATVVSFVEKKKYCNIKLSLNEDFGSEEPIG